jgi:hypothetical protein
MMMLTTAPVKKPKIIGARKGAKRAEITTSTARMERVNTAANRSGIHGMASADLDLKKTAAQQTRTITGTEKTRRREGWRSAPGGQGNRFSILLTLIFTDDAALGRILIGLQPGLSVEKPILRTYIYNTHNTSLM